MVISYRRFGIYCPETSLRNHHYSLRNDPDERSSNLLRGGNPKSKTHHLPHPYIRLIPYMIKTARYYNVTWRCVRVTSVTVEEQDAVHILSVCVCVCAALVILYGERMRHIIPSSVACPAFLIVPQYPTNGKIFRKKKSLNTKCVLFFYTFCPKHLSF